MEEEVRLHLWEEELQRLATSLRTRRDRLEEDQSLCLQLEASLVELTHENATTKRSLDQLEVQLNERRFALDKRMEEVASSLSHAEEALRHQRDRQDGVSESIDDGWRAIEDELKSIDTCHAYEVSRMKKSQRELEEREALIREKMRAVGEREQELHTLQRRLNGRENLLLEINRTSLNRKVSELQEREALLHNEDGV